MNMQFLKSFLTSLLLSAIFQSYLPWWSAALAAMISGYLFAQSKLQTFLASFSALLLLWAGYAAWLDYRNGHILSERLSQLILKSENGFLMIALTGICGAVVGGAASLTGLYARRLLQPSKG
jgi:hypothetical protein